MDPPAKPRRRWPRRVAIGAAVAVAALGIPFGVHVWLAQRELDREIEAWTDAGCPRRFDDILAPASSPEGNAMEVYQQGFTMLEAIPGEDLQLAEEAWDTPDAAPVVEAARPALDLVREGAARPSCTWEPDAPAGWEGRDARILSAFRAMVLLRAEAWARAEGGDSAGAAASLDAGLAMGEHVFACSTETHWILHHAIRWQVLKAFEEIFRDREVPNADRWIEIVGGHATRDEFGRMLRGIGAGVLSMHDDGTLLYRVDGLDLPIFAGVRRRDLARMLRRLREALPAAAAPYAGRGRMPPTEPEGHAPMARAFARAIPLHDQRTTAAEALEALALAALRLRAIRAESGAYPEAFDEVADPVDGAPLRYRRTETGFELRSIGCDTLRTPDPPDLTWRWN